MVGTWQTIKFCLQVNPDLLDRPETMVHLGLKASLGKRDSQGSKEY